MHAWLARAVVWRVGLSLGIWRTLGIWLLEVLLLRIAPVPAGLGIRLGRFVFLCLGDADTEEFKSEEHWG